MAKTLGPAGFDIATSSSDALDQQQAQVLTLNGAKARATLTFQDDNSGLREQFASIRTSADGD